MSLQPGSTIEGRYRVERLLGQGGMGAVYQAWDLRLAQWVALKENALTATEAQIQFEQEARVLARLRHPNLPRVIDHFITSAGVQYLVMDFVDGPNLAELVRARGRQAPADVSAWLGQVCDALTYLHNQNPPVIHRDIKPQNIKLTADGRAVLVDFGLSKVGAGRERTATGALGITPGFSPPEQYGAGRTDQRSDIYALAATLYAALTGETPPDSVQRAIQSVQLAPPRQFNPSLSPALEGALLHGLSTQPARRPGSIREFQVELQQALGTATDQPMALAAAAGAGLMRPPSVPRQPSTPPPSAPRQPSTPPPSVRGGIPAWAWFAVGIFVVFLLLGSGIFLATRGAPGAKTPAAASLATDVSPAVTAADVAAPTASGASRSGAIDITSEPVASAVAPVVPAPGVVSASATVTSAPTAERPTTTPSVPTPTVTPKPPTASPTAVPPATATSAPRAAVTPCPSYLHKPKPGMGLLLIENHLGEPLHIDRIGTGEKWDLPPKRGDTPARLLIDLAPGDHEFVDNTSGGYGHIKVSITPGSAFVAPIWYNDRAEELIYPLDIPNGCR